MLREQLSSICWCRASRSHLFSLMLCGRIAHNACSVIKKAPTQTCAEAFSWLQQRLRFRRIRIRTAFLQPLGGGAANITKRSLLACVSAWQASVPPWLQLCDGLTMSHTLFSAHLYLLLTVMTSLPGLIEQGAGSIKISH